MHRNKASFRQQGFQGLVVVDELVAPVSDIVVEDHAGGEGRRRFKGGWKLLQRPLGIIGHFSIVRIEQEPCQLHDIRCRDTNFAARLERSIAFMDDELRRGKQHVLDHVLGVEIVHGLFRKGKPLGHVDEYNLRLIIGVEPTRPSVVAGAEADLDHAVRLVVSAYAPVARQFPPSQPKPPSQDPHSAGIRSQNVPEPGRQEVRYFHGRVLA
jgi:hypothetical protein